MFSNSEIPMFFICSIVMNITCLFCTWQYSCIWLRNNSKNCVSPLVSKNRSQKLINRSYLNSRVLLVYLYCVLHMYTSDIGIMVRVFANGPGDLGSIPARVIPKTQKMVLDASLLNTPHYKVRINGKTGAIQGKENHSPLYLGVVAI